MHYPPKLTSSAVDDLTRKRIKLLSTIHDKPMYTIIRSAIILYIQHKTDMTIEDVDRMLESMSTDTDSEDRAA